MSAQLCDLPNASETTRGVVAETPDATKLLAGLIVGGALAARAGSTTRLLE